MDISYHTLDPTNKHLLDNIAPDVFDHDIKQSSLQAFLIDDRHAMILAVSEGQVVGMASAFEYYHPDKKPELFINEVGVTPSHRRRGIGRSLVRRLLDFAKDRGCVYAWLGTDKDNVPGRACFGSVGGAEPTSEFILYEWKLDQ